LNLSLEGIHHAYEGKVVLCDVSLTVRPGEVACLLGPSGCGKTTLLRIAAGLEVAGGGRVVIGGRLVADADAGLHVPPEARRVGLMFQDYALFPHLTVFDNVAFGVTDRSPATRARLHEALDRMGLEGYARSYPHVLSGGQQQRCALLRALAPEPDILLLDEPFSNLDVTLRADVRDQALALLKERRVTTLVVTHDPQEAMAIAERLWILYEGQVVQSGTPEEIYARPRHASIARLFGPVNAILGVVRAGTVATPLGTFEAPDLGEGTPAQVLIRPEGLRIVTEEGAGAAAQVIAAQLLGRLTRLRLAVAGIADPLDALVPGVAHPLPGESVLVNVDGELATVFAAEPRAA
jgi:iron(III) transport system ATP-binding protein